MLKYRICAFLVAIITYFFSYSSSFALTALLKAELRKLDPQTRMEQRCDIAAMEAIASTHKFAPDKALAYSFSDPIIKGNLFVANGAAFRSHNHWYHLTYKCITSDDKLDIVSFDYKIGAQIPRSEWEHYYLVP